MGLADHLDSRRMVQGDWLAFVGVLLEEAAVVQ